MLLGIAILGAVAWVLLTIFEPLVWTLDVTKKCDKKYAFDRIRRAQRYEELAELHSMSPLYQQMKQEKRLNHKERRKARRRAARAHLQGKKSSILKCSAANETPSTDVVSQPGAQINKKTK